MNAKKVEPESILQELIDRYPALEACRESIVQAFDALVRTHGSDGKLLIAGNGGSAADSDHISGEMTKSFRFKRALDPALQSRLEELYGDDGVELSKNLEGGLKAIPLTVFNAANSAFNNDVAPEAAYAQLVQVFGREGDVFLGITTSGNSKNIILALMAANARGMTTIVLTGSKGGKCVGFADICIRVPEDETFKVQELHLPVYHALCAMVESALFSER